MTKYMIIDDEFMAHDIIKEYCNLLPNLQFAKSCEDAIEALAYLKSNDVDLIFLDLNMPKLKGFEFLRTLQNPPKVIVTTAYKEHALEGYELNIVDYLLKPFSFERFLTAVNKATASTVTTSTTTKDTPTSQRKSIFLNSDKQHIQVFIDSITHVEAAGNYCKVFYEDRIISVRDKISQFLTRLPADDFSQVHKSFIIAHQHIEKIEGARISIGKHVVPVGKMYKENVKALIEE